MQVGFRKLRGAEGEPEDVKLALGGGADSRR